MGNAAKPLKREGLAAIAWASSVDLLSQGSQPSRARPSAQTTHCRKPYNLLLSSYTSSSPSQNHQTLANDYKEYYATEGNTRDAGLTSPPHHGVFGQAGGMPTAAQDVTCSLHFKRYRRAGTRYGTLLPQYAR